MQLQTICVFRKHDTPQADGLAAEIRRWAGERSVAVLDGEELEAGSRPDLLVVLGGDGTFLSAVRRLDGQKVPVLGVNLGSLGFLTEITVEELFPMLELLADGEPTLERRMTLSGELVRDGRVLRAFHVFNDVVVSKGALARISEVEVSVDGRFLTNYRADGLIVSTPSGSTAYNLSAGGPIVSPWLSSILVAPICPHAMTHRPILLGGEAQVEMRICAKNGELYVTLDGQEGEELEEGDRICVRKGESDVLLVRSPDRDYFSLLRSKLMWGGRNDLKSSEPTT